MLATGGVWLSKVTLRNEDVLRACVTSYLTQASDVEALVEQAESAVQARGLKNVIYQSDFAERGVADMLKDLTKLDWLNILGWGRVWRRHDSFYGTVE